MAWNEPGGSNNNDPWGNRNKKDDQGPPDLDEVIKNLNDKFGKVFGGGGSGSGKSGGPAVGGAGIFVILLIAMALWGFSGIYTVEEGQEAVVMQFGAYNHTSGSGIHWYAPGIQSIETVDVSAVRGADFGARAVDGLMLTEDENIVSVEVSVQYRVRDSQEYLFNTRDPDFILRQVTESALREVVGKNTMDFVLKEGRDETSAKTEKLAQDILDRYKTGLIISKVTLQQVQPPQQVQHAFNDVIKAREDNVRYVNQAEAYRNDILPKARGQAARQMEEANAYKSRVIAEAEGDVSRFLSILAEYEKAPEVTRERLYLDAMEAVMSNTSKVMVDTQGGNNLLYLPLDKIIQQQRMSNTSSLSGVPSQAIETPSTTNPSRFDSSRSRSRETR